MTWRFAFFLVLGGCFFGAISMAGLYFVPVQQTMEAWSSVCLLWSSARWAKKGVEGGAGRQNGLRWRWNMVSGFGAGVAGDKAKMGKVS